MGWTPNYEVLHQLQQDIVEMCNVVAAAKAATDVYLTVSDLVQPDTFAEVMGALVKSLEPFELA